MCEPGNLVMTTNRRTLMSLSIMPPIVLVINVHYHNSLSLVCVVVDNSAYPLY